MFSGGGGTGWEPVLVLSGVLIFFHSYGQTRERFLVGPVVVGRAKLPLSREVGTRKDSTARRQPRPPECMRVTTTAFNFEQSSFTALSFGVPVKTNSAMQRVGFSRAWYGVGLICLVFLAFIGSGLSPG